MARYRTIKPELFADEKLTEVSRDCRLLFLGLLCFVDDKGRKRYNSARVKNEIFPGDEDVSPRQVDAWIQQLARTGVIRLYNDPAEEGKLLWIPHFTHHQRIDRPSHSDIPAHPFDRDPDCQCHACRKERGDGDLQHYHRNERRNGRGRPVSTTPRVVPDSSGNPRDVPEDSLCSVVECSVVKANTTPTPEQNGIDPQSEHGWDKLPDIAKDRRAESATLDEIAKRSLQLLEISSNPLILKALTDTIKARSKLKGCTLEAAAQQLMAGAALVKTEQGEPEHWQQWFEDQRYVYVPLGDSRIEDWREHARPVCGGKLCIEGWEPVTVNGVKVLRRCPNCVQAWQDAGRM